MALTDEQIRQAGILYLAPQKYLKNPLKIIVLNRKYF